MTCAVIPEKDWIFIELATVGGWKTVAVWRKPDGTFAMTLTWPPNVGY